MTTERIRKEAQRRYPPLTLSSGGIRTGGKREPNVLDVNEEKRDTWTAGATYALSLNKWVPVESLEINRFVLLYNGHWVGVGRRLDMTGYEDAPEFAQWADETGEYINPIPTHYMELPSPPKTSEI